MSTRTARTAWNGDIQQGSGRVELASSGVGAFDVSFPRRTADAAEGVTSPEELIAAAHSSCFAMAFSLEVANAGGTPGKTDVTADVTLTPANSTMEPMTFSADLVEIYGKVVTVMRRY